MGGPYFEALTLALPLPFFFPFADFSAAVDWTAWNSEVLPGLGGFWDELLGTAFETDFCLEEVLARVWDTEPITPSMGGTAGDFEMMITEHWVITRIKCQAESKPDPSTGHEKWPALQ